MATSSESSPDLEGLDTPGGGVVLEATEELLPLDGSSIDSPVDGSSAASSSSPTAPVSEQFQNSPTFLGARAYQHEMFAESMKRNIILAMDTGSGKTRVAVLRIQAELDQTSAEKIVWFIAPTVQLCNQQHQVLRTQIPAVQIKLLRGEDNIEAWSNQETWDAALLNVRIVVSTPQILQDALTHAFLSMDRLALIVFDEAHNAVKKSSYSKIMEDFYHTRKGARQYVPHIMGLTASPIMNSNLDGIETLETTLDAICRSPSIHRSELLAHVKRPTIRHAFYQGSLSPPVTPTYTSLVHAFRSLDIREDPYILHLRTLGTDRSRRDLQKAFIGHDTYCHRQMVSFCQRSKNLLTTLGPWAADLYIWQVVTKFQKLANADSQLLGTWKHDEKLYMLRILGGISVEKPAVAALDTQTVTDKVSVLLSQLLAAEEGAVGIVFVRERHTASMLAEMVRAHPQTKERFPNVGVMAGTSQAAARKRDIWDLVQGGNSSLDDFRAGNSNLLISTSVLEEGIDVPSCNLVICFERPPNLKSFIQVRGRARERDSKLVVLLDRTTPGTNEWESLEAQMKKQYEDQDRERKRLAEIEDSEGDSSEKYIVESTQAVLSHDNAKGHLAHFCAVMSPGEYIDSRPDYITQATDETQLPFLTTTVILPSYIPSFVRRAVSMGRWKSEKNATKDAAFQAYVALHKAGLVNDHLLPLQPGDIVPRLDRRPSMVEVNGLINIWAIVAQAWKTGCDEVWVASVTLKDPTGMVQGEYEMAIPVPLPTISPMPVYFSHRETWSLEFGPFEVRSRSRMNDHTAVLLALNFRHRQLSDEKRHVVSFGSRSGALTIDMVGGSPVSSQSPDLECLVRNEQGVPFVLQTVLPCKPPREHVQKLYSGYKDVPGFDEAPENVPWVAVRKWPRRVDCLHSPNAFEAVEPVSSKLYYRAYPAEMFRADTASKAHARFGLLIPSILHQVKIRLIAQALSTSLLANVGVSDQSLVLTAISAGSAEESTNYERLETLGDTILKLCTTTTVAAIHMDWPEGYLSSKKDSLVSNERLYHAALDKGLDKFILNKKFTGLKWRPIYIDSLAEETQDDTGPRIMSTKTLADVVEALIGASYCDGGIPKALSCISTFVSELEWKPIEIGRQMLFDNAPSETELPSTLVPLEELLGYTFRKKALLVEATTHASANIGVASGCLERLEFIGDAVLDYIIVGRLFPNNSVRHSNVHLLKTATVNADILGFMCLEHHIVQEQSVIVPPSPHDSPGGVRCSGPAIERSTFALPLWKFMRHSCANIESEQEAMLARHAAHRETLLDALWHGKEFPWALLARMQIKKFYSDLVEAIIGGVWVDSGDMDACAAVISRFGIIPLLDRLARDEVHIMHPKQELGHFVDSATVEYVHYASDAVLGRNQETSGAAEDGVCGSRCRIMVGNQCLVDIEACGPRLATETSAAEMGVRILKERGRTREA